MADRHFMNPIGSRRWRDLVLVAAFAFGTIAAADLTFQRLSPPHRLSEVEDALRLYRASDPHVLVLGSSHARTFEVVADDLAVRTGGERSLVAVPVEHGKLSAYEWVLQHRLRPLIEERRDGVPMRTNLDTFVLVTEWWDSELLDEPAWNLPSRAWTFWDFVQDFARHGLTDYNRNYVTSRWTRSLLHSVLVQDRGYGRIIAEMKTRALGDDPRAVQAGFEFRTRKWQTMTERGYETMADPSEMAALSRILDYAQGLGVDVHVVLYPRKPGTLTETAISTTLASFSEIVAEIGRDRGIAVHDWTLDSPIGDDDFMADFDHVTHEGNERLSRWMLDGDLRRLARPRELAEETTEVEATE